MPTIDIVMCTKNGASFINEQLQSFEAQHHRDWRLWISDDASSDKTLDVVAAFKAAHPHRDITVFDGPAQGSAANFLTAVSHPALAHAWVAFSDQDDVWFPDKLARAVEALRQSQNAVYAARHLLTDHRLRPLKLTAQNTEPYGFGNALVQNVLGGNTIVMPPEVTDLIRASVSAARAARVPFHDWWIYQVVTGVGITVSFDRHPCVYYRQHRHNVIGSSHGGANRLARLRKLQTHGYADWISRNLDGLSQIKDMLAPDNVKTLERFQAWRTERPKTRAALDTLGLYRQTRAGNAVLRVLARSGRL